MAKPLIVVDIDDVLSESAAGFARYSNARWGSNITANDYQEDWAAVWNVSPEVAVKRALQFHDDGVVADYSCIVNARVVLKNLSSKYRLINVTSRRLSIKPQTDDWIARHFPGVFEDTIYAGIWDKDHVDGREKSLASTKTIICLDMNAAFIIDDQIKHCLSAAENGVTAILFGEYPWNRTDSALSNVISKSNWHEVGEYLNGRG